jgi:hypothetical protein
MADEAMVSDVPGAVQDQAPVVEQGSSNNDAPAAQPETPAAPVEKMIPQSQVNKIAAREAHQAAERAKREAYEEFQRQQPQNNQAQVEKPQNIGGMNNAHDPEQIRKLIREEAYRISTQENANRIAQNFESKMDAAKEKYADFDEKYAALNIEQHPELVLWTQGMDNVGDVMYDIASNPTKVAQVLMLARGGFPQLAQQELHKLSASIAANEAAKKVPEVPEPLGQVKPSNIGADSGDMSVSDFRKMFRG